MTKSSSARIARRKKPIDIAPKFNAIDLNEGDQAPIISAGRDANRRYHQCRHDGCDSQSRWQLLLQINCRHPADWNRPMFMLKMPSTLCVCDKHTKAAMEIATNEHARNQIRNICWQQGYGVPDFSSMIAMFAPVDHETVVEQLVQ